MEFEMDWDRYEGENRMLTMVDKIEELEEENKWLKLCIEKLTCCSHV